MNKPKNAIAPSSALVWAHGGGAVTLTAQISNPMMVRWAYAFNCIVFNVDYRLGPETKCPGGQRDQMKAFIHIYNHSEKYGVDKTKIVMGGESGGAWITLGAAYQLVIVGKSNLPKMIILRCPMISNETQNISKE